MRSDALHTPEIQPAQAKLLLAVMLSLALHLALVFLVQVKPPTRHGTRVTILQVALSGRIAADSRKTDGLQPPPSPQKTERAIPPEPAPAVPALPGESAAPPPEPIQDPLPSLSPAPALEIPMVEDPVYYTAKQVDMHPAVLEPVNPDFPGTAVRAGLEGFVRLRLLIDDAGMVREISVVEAQPPDTFEEAALSAFRNARFLPAQRNGRPVKSDVLIEVKFDLVHRNKR